MFGSFRVWNGFTHWTTWVLEGLSCVNKNIRGMAGMLTVLDEPLWESPAGYFLSSPSPLPLQSMLKPNSLINGTSAFAIQHWRGGVWDDIPLRFFFLRHLLTLASRIIASDENRLSGPVYLCRICLSISQFVGSNYENRNKCPCIIGRYLIK